jgi:hypothetical protein
MDDCWSLSRGVRCGHAQGAWRLPFRRAVGGPSPPRGVALLCEQCGLSARAWASTAVPRCGFVDGNGGERRGCEGGGGGATGAGRFVFLFARVRVVAPPRPVARVRVVARSRVVARAGNGFARGCVQPFLRDSYHARPPRYSEMNHWAIIICPSGAQVRPSGAQVRPSGAQVRPCGVWVGRDGAWAARFPT